MDTRKKTDDIMRVSPAFADCSEAIVFCVNDSYCPILSVMLYSVMEHVSPARVYDIVILHRDITPVNQKILQNMGAEKNNVSIRFLNVAALISDYTLFVGGKAVFTIDAYLRLLIPYVLDDVYQKALYLDADMLALADVGELLDTNVDDFLLASSRDLTGLAEYYDSSSMHKRNRDEVLKLEKPDDYFIDGMLVLNLEAFREKYTSDELLELAASRNWLQHDQDVLNVICNGGKAKILHAQWDVLKPYHPERLPQEYRVEHDEALASPKIVHFGGDDKPWKVTGNPWDDLFWDTAIKTPYYKAIIYSVIDKANTSREKMIEKHRNEIESIYASQTFRAGSMLTWLPRMIRNAVQKVLPHRNR